MFSNIDDWTSDAKLESTGVPLDLGRGRVIYTRRAGGANRQFAVAVAEVLRRIVGNRDPANVPDEEFDANLRKLYAEHVVINWSGFKDEAGKEIPYTPARFLELVALAPDIWIEVRTFAKQRESFRANGIDRDKAALGKSSRGKRSGGVSAHA